MPIVQAINGIVETYPVRPVTPREPVVDAVDSQAGKEPRQQAGDRTQQAAQQGPGGQAPFALGHRPALTQLGPLLGVEPAQPGGWNGLGRSPGVGGRERHRGVPPCQRSRTILNSRCTAGLRCGRVTSKATQPRARRESTFHHWPPSRVSMSTSMSPV